MKKTLILIIIILLTLTNNVFAGKNKNDINTNSKNSFVVNKTICFDTVKKSPSLFILYLKFFDSPVLNLNIQQGWRTMGEVTFGLADYQPGIKILGLQALETIELGSQLNFTFNHFVIGPELTYNSSFFIINYGASIIYFTDFRNGTLFINPHIGLTFFTYFDLYAGYNIPLMHNHMKSSVNNYTFTLAVPILQRYNSW